MIGLDEHLRVILPHLGRPLLCPEHRDRLLAAVRCIPSAAAEILGCECRLGGSARPDFLFGASAAGGGRAVLAGGHPRAPLPPRLLAHPNWTAIGRFLSAWAEPGSLLFRRADEVFLEFDLDGADPGIVRPSFFFGVRTGQADARSGLAAMAVLEAGLGVLTGQPLPAAHRERIRTLLEALPSGGLLDSVGLMLSRPQVVTRLYLRGIPTGAVEPFLRQVGWDGAWPSLSAGLGLAARFVDQVALDLDVDHGLGPVVGLECMAPTVPAMPGWEPFLAHLADRALCLPEEREALLAYGGVCRPGAGSWPRDLGAAGELLGGRAGYAFRRYLNHVKLVVDPGRGLAAKAYLAAKRIRCGR